MLLIYKSLVLIYIKMFNFLSKWDLMLYSVSYHVLEWWDFSELNSLIQVYTILYIW